jgi:hypothetical protein
VSALPRPKLWQWPANMGGESRVAVSCILWELYENGPAESMSGDAYRVLCDRLVARESPYTGRPGQRSISHMVRRLAGWRSTWDYIERDARSTSVFALSCKITRREELPHPYPFGPNPALDAGPAPSLPLKLPPATHTVMAEPAEEVELLADLTPADALMAVRNLIDDALGPAPGVMERLEAAVERIGELEAEVAGLEDKLMGRVREVEVLRRALAKRRAGG